MSTIGTALGIANQSVSFVYCDGCSYNKAWPESWPRISGASQSNVTTFAFEKYKIQSGDTLSQLAQRFKTTVDGLKTRNSISDADFIRAGEVISIPR